MASSGAQTNLSPNAPQPEAKGGLYRFLDIIERAGNALPHPFLLFIYITIILGIISAIVSWAGVEVINPSNKSVIKANNLLSADGLRWLLTNAVKNFTNFAPLGLVLTMMLGIGLAEKVGFMSALMRKTMTGAPVWAVSLTVFFIGINGNIASDASIIIIPAIAATVYQSMGKNPLVGLLAGYAAANCGFSANILIAGTDSLLAGITQEAARIIDPNATVNPAVNWYFMVVSTFVLTFLGAWMTDKVIAPRFGDYKGSAQLETSHELTELELKGLKKAGIAALIFVIILLLLVVPPDGILRDPKKGTIIPSPFLNGIIPILLLLFVTVSVVYGKTVGTIKTSNDIPKHMAEAMKTMSSYIVLVFVMGQFVAAFNWTNLGKMFSIAGAEFLENVGFTGIPLMLGIMVLTCIVEFFIGSGSAKWAIMAPIFVPMLMLLGYSPALTQLIYRIGDSAMNPVSPLYSYFPIILEMARKYDENAGVGTIVSTMIPYSVAFLVVWTVMLMIWIVLGIPLGPGGELFLAK